MTPPPPPLLHRTHEALQRLHPHDTVSLQHFLASDGEFSDLRSISPPLSQAGERMGWGFGNKAGEPAAAGQRVKPHSSDWVGLGPVWTSIASFYLCVGLVKNSIFLAAQAALTGPKPSLAHFFF